MVWAGLEIKFSESETTIKWSKNVAESKMKPRPSNTGLKNKTDLEYYTLVLSLDKEFVSSLSSKVSRLLPEQQEPMFLCRLRNRTIS